MHKTRLSLLYLGSYLTLIGLGLLFVPAATLRLLQSNAQYGNIFPRVAGMLMSGLGIAVFGIIRARAAELYLSTLVVRAYFLVCIAGFYSLTSDPLFLALIVIVGIGLVLTLSSCLLDRRKLAMDQPGHNGLSPR